MKTLKAHIVLGAFLASLAFGAVAQESSKVGYINIQRITSESSPAKAAQSKLEQEFKKRQTDLADTANTLKAAQEKLERDAPTLPESQRISRQKEFGDQSRDFQRRQREFQEDLNARRNEELQQVLEKANKAIKNVAEAEKFDLIIQEAVFANPKNDITDKVLKALNGGK